MNTISATEKDHGYEPHKASFGNGFRSKLRGINPPLRGIVQLTNSATLSKLEFHNQIFFLKHYQEVLNTIRQIGYMT